MTIDTATLNDLVTFAAAEVAARDIEPWADIIAALHTAGRLTRADTLWVATLYNTYDDLGSAWACYRRWPSITAWATAPDRADAAAYPCTQERRSLRGGKVLHRFGSYAAHTAALGDPEPWFWVPIVGDHPGADFARLTAHMRQIWGVGRQSAFEWAEFTAKTIGLPVDAADGQLWESSGPRRALERIFNTGRPAPTPQWLDKTAAHCKHHLAANGVDLSWFDFETVICDFNVMRDGRYYVGRHMAAITEEIAGIPDPADRAMLTDALASFAGEWAGIRPGINKRLMPVYRDTGRIITTPEGH